MQQRIDTKTLYAVIADTLPAEGRDFTIDVATGADGKQQLVIKPLTAVGRGFVPVLLERLAGPMAKTDVTVAQDGKVEQELATIRSIRKRIEDEEAAAVEAKLKSLRREKDELKAAADSLHRARVAKTGETSQLPQDELDAFRKAETARRTLEHAEQVAAKIPDMRKLVDMTAREMATNDEKDGVPRDVDFDAPLKSLFDRQDVADSVKYKEQLVRRMAAAVVTADELRVQAASAAKRYALPKGPDKAEK